MPDYIGFVFAFALLYTKASAELSFINLKCLKRLRCAQNEKKLYISGGSDHHGLCSGYYERYANPFDAPCYAQLLAYGTTKEYFEEIKNRKLNRY